MKKIAIENETDILISINIPQILQYTCVQYGNFDHDVCNPYSLSISR